MLDFNEEKVDKKIKEMESKMIMYHHPYDEKEIKSNPEFIKRLLDMAIEHKREKMIDYLTLTIEEFKVIKQEYYNILKNCKISIFMESINDITLDDLEEISQKYKVHYFCIKDLATFDDSSQISLDLVYKYKKAIYKITQGINNITFNNSENREKEIFGILITRILKNTRYDLNSQENYENNSKITKFGKPTFDNPSNEIIGILQGKCVCRGFAGIVRDVFNSVNIDCIVISGISNNGGHAWNQIKLDGEWYNIDITWDRDNIIQNGESYWLLKDDERFENGYLIHNEKGITNISHKIYSIDRTRGHICTKSLSKSELAKYIDFSEFRKKSWLKNLTKNISLNKMKLNIASMLQDTNETRMNGSKKR